MSSHPWDGDRCVRTRLIDRGGRYPLRRVEETLRRQADGSVRISGSQRMVADHIFVQLKPGQEAQATLAQAGCTLRKAIPKTDLVLAAFTYDSHAAYTQRMQALQALDGVVSAEADGTMIRPNSAPAKRTRDQGRVVPATAGVAAGAAAPAVIPRTLPNDPLFTQQWDRDNQGQTTPDGGAEGDPLPDADIDAPEAWSLTTGSRQVLVAVIDDGMDINHEDLQANVWTNPGESGLDAQRRNKATNGIDDDGNGYVDDVHGYDMAEGDNDVGGAPWGGHGTNCAGIIGADGNNGTGGAGVCWSVSLVPIKIATNVTQSDEAYFSASVEAFYYAHSLGVAITSNSWGAGTNEAAIRNLSSPIWKTCMGATKDMLLVAAAGNSAVDNDVTQDWPSGDLSEHIIAVAATDNRDRLWFYSCFGLRSVDLAAPAGGSQVPAFGGGYAAFDGTSMAAPQVAGVAALLKAYRPTLTAAQLKQAILSSTDPLPGLYGKILTGGRLNAYRALLAAQDPTRLTPTYPLLSLVSIATREGAGGNGNGVVEAGEAMEVAVTVRSSGTAAFQGLQGSLAIVSGPGAIVQGNAAYGNLAIDAQASRSFTLRPSGAGPIQANLRFQDQAQRTWDFPLKLSLDAQVSGVVRSSQGTPIPFATVSASGVLNGGFTRQATADAQGRYRLGFPSILAVTLTAEAVGWDFGYWPNVSYPPSVTSFDPVLARPAISLAEVQLASPIDSPVPSQDLGLDSRQAGVVSSGLDPLQALLSVRYAPDLTSGLWHQTERKSDEGRFSFWCGREDIATYERNLTTKERFLKRDNNGVRSALIAAVVLPQDNPLLSLRSWLATEDTYDQASIWIAPRSGVTVPASTDKAWTQIYASKTSLTAWHTIEQTLSGKAGAALWIRFQFDPDVSYSNFEGWYLDDIRVGGQVVRDWLPTVDPTRGDIPAGTTQDLAVSASARVLPPGVYSYQLEAVSNAPAKPVTQSKLTWLVTGALPSPWTRSEALISGRPGTPGLAGYVADRQRFLLSGGAQTAATPPLSAGRDVVLATRSLTGDGQVVARLASGPFQRESGITVRGVLNKAIVDLATTLDGPRVAWTSPSGTTAAPLTTLGWTWLKIQRQGGTLTGFVSANGTTWTQVGAYSSPSLPASVQVGLMTRTRAHTDDGGPADAPAVFEQVAVASKLTAPYQVYFFPSVTTGPVGFLRDGGAIFGRNALLGALDYGWLRSNTQLRDRGASVPWPRRGAAAMPTAWELAVPDGRYVVEAELGESGAIPAGTRYQLQAEGVTLLDAVPTAARPWHLAAGQVTVVDGRLTLSAGPLANGNQLSWIRVSPVPTANQ